MTSKTNRDRVLNFAVIGCGRISEKHFSALASGALKSRLAAVCDIDEEKARSKGARYSVPHYLDYREMLDAHPETDVISVLTPSGYHCEHVIDVARYGKHIIVEKPMALRVGDCDAMMAACRKSGCRLFVVKQNRFNRAVVAARKALDKGRFGKMVMGTVCVRWRRDQPYYEQADWRGTWALDGGVISQQASHHLDLLQWFMGPIESVQCQTATRLLDVEVEDTAAAMVRFKSGALGIFEATVATRPEDLCGSLSLLGEHGTIVIGGVAVNKVEYWKFETPAAEDASAAANFSDEVPTVYGHGHMPYIAHVIDAILARRRALVEGAEGKKNIEILTALYESAATGGAAVVPGQPVRHARIGERKAVSSKAPAV
jgi:predicted dehydrogenase